MSENDEVGIWLPVPTGRAHDDSLSATARAIVDYVLELPRDERRAIVTELLSWEKFRLDVEELLGDVGGEA